MPAILNVDVDVHIIPGVEDVLVQADLNEERLLGIRLIAAEGAEGAENQKNGASRFIFNPPYI